MLGFPVATATVERCFPAMKLVKSNLRNQMGDDILNFALICAVEKKELAEVTEEHHDMVPQQNDDFVFPPIWVLFMFKQCTFNC